VNAYELQAAVGAAARACGRPVMPGAGFGGVDWDVRICLAALSIDELTAVGSAIAAAVDHLVNDTP
jgi:hypothetical protein